MIRKFKHKNLIEALNDEEFIAYIAHQANNEQRKIMGLEPYDIEAKMKETYGSMEIHN